MAARDAEAVSSLLGDSDRKAQAQGRGQGLRESDRKGQGQGRGQGLGNSSHLSIAGHTLLALLT